MTTKQRLLVSTLRDLHIHRPEVIDDLLATYWYPAPVVHQLVAVLRRYQARYHGTPHAQEDYELGVAALDNATKHSIHTHHQ